MKADRLVHRRYGRPGPSYDQSRAGGLTLVETLLALLLGGMIVTVSAVVTIQAVSVQKTVRTVLNERWGRERVFNTFETDVRNMITWLPDSVQVLRLPPEADTLATIVCLVPTASGDSALPRRMPARVTYLLDRSAADTGMQMVREVVHLHDPQRIIHRRALTHGLASATVERLGADGWRANESAPSEQEMRAVRLKCRWGGPQQREDVRIVPIASQGLADRSRP